MSEIIKAHIPCPECGSHDAASLYDDGHIYCFSCQKSFKDGSSDTTKHHKNLGIIPVSDMEIHALKHRGISADTCQKFGYYITRDKDGTALQVANYYDDDGSIIFQKTRDGEKHFCVYGNSVYRFFGQNLFNSGKKLIITEGEIDCLSVSQMNGNKYPVVSLPHGCGSAKKTFMANLDWLNGFDEVVVMFDMDEQGQKAVKTVCGLLKPHQLKIAKLPMKDANECLVAGCGGDIIKAIFDAKEYRPDGIINAKDVEKQFFEDDTEANSFSYPWCDGLNNKTHGIRKGEMILLTAGTGIGKSTAAREIAYKLKTFDKLKIGMVMLEENYKKTIRELLSIHTNKPLSMIWSNVDKKALEEPYKELFSDGGFVLYDHFGSLESDNLLDKIRYLIVSEGCDFVIFDHISIAVSGMDDGMDERKTIDKLMTQLRSLVEETGAGMIVISHLKKTSGDNKSFEEGGIISLDDLRGSGSLKQIPDEILALERNQQSDDESEKNTIKVRLLKNRFAGETGLCGYLYWNKEKHRLLGNEDDEECQF